MEYTKHLQHVSNEYEIVVIKYQKIHLKASVLTRFWALEPVRGRLGDHPGMGTLKAMEKPLLGTSFWSVFMTDVGTFVVTIFICFLNLSPSIFLLP